MVVRRNDVGVYLGVLRSLVNMMVGHPRQLMAGCYNRAEQNIRYLVIEITDGLMERINSISGLLARSPVGVDHDWLA